MSAATHDDGQSSWKIIVSVRRSGVGTYSTEYVLAEEPTDGELRNLIKETRVRYALVYGYTGDVVIDVTVRRATG